MPPPAAVRPGRFAESSKLWRSPRRAGRGAGRATRRPNIVVAVSTNEAEPNGELAPAIDRTIDSRVNEAAEQRQGSSSEDPHGGHWRNCKGPPSCQRTATAQGKGTAFAADKAARLLGPASGTLRLSRPSGRSARSKAATASSPRTNRSPPCCGTRHGSGAIALGRTVGSRRPGPCSRRRSAPCVFSDACR